LVAICIFHVKSIASINAQSLSWSIFPARSPSIKATRGEKRRKESPASPVPWPSLGSEAPQSGLSPYLELISLGVD
jgi:hypothetical protein